MCLVRTIMWMLGWKGVGGGGREGRSQGILEGGQVTSAPVKSVNCRSENLIYYMSSGTLTKWFLYQREMKTSIFSSWNWFMHSMEDAWNPPLPFSALLSYYFYIKLIWRHLKYFTSLWNATTPLSHLSSYQFNHQSRVMNSLLFPLPPFPCLSFYPLSMFLTQDRHSR